MASLLAFLSKLAGRPSTVWRLAWLAFCLLVVCLLGARTLRKIVPYVLAGVGDKPAAPLLPEGARGQPEDDSQFANWILPVLGWLVLAGLLLLIFLQH
jgi:hypothetical protein